MYFKIFKLQNKFSVADKFYNFGESIFNQSKQLTELTSQLESWSNFLQLYVFVSTLPVHMMPTGS